MWLGCAATSEDRSYSGAGGTGGAGGAGGSTADAGMDAPTSCEGVVCNTPPSNTCANENQLRVHESQGTCDQGACVYASQLVDCPQGCNANACIGDPCIGVTCTTPPSNTCVDATHLAVYDVPGSCHEGACAYTTHNEYCAHGCANGSCEGDPCVGVTCASPPASYCSSADKLVVYAATGTCTDGVCSYTTQEHDCEFGCDQGACEGNPCVGVTCNTPPASHCANATTLQQYSAEGTCSQGVCSYPATTLPCAHGCSGGVCRECTVTLDCAGGNWCSDGVCVPCNDNTHCGSSCANCTASGDVCNAGSTMCVDCNVDGDCGSGKWCSANVCTACNTSDHCGTSCVACESTHPTCDGSQCQCTPTSCPSYQQCVGGACGLCQTSAACGASCSACPSNLPHCFAEAATSSCVECLNDGHCTGGYTCDPSLHVCKDPCWPPVVSCTTGTQSRDGWNNARTIGRTAAATGSGYQISDNTCYANDRFDESSGCWDANSDHTYRIYLRATEKIDVTLTTGEPCGYYASWYATFSVYGATGGCQGTTKGSRLFCVDQKTSHVTSYTAPADGWYYVIVDGSSAFDDEGDYTFRVKLTCKTAGCECG